MIEKIKKETKTKKLTLPEKALQTFASSRYLQPYSLFYLVNKEYPSKINFINIDKVKLMEKLLKTFEMSEKELIISKTFDFESGSYKFNSVIIPIKQDIFIYFNPGIEDVPAVEILFSSNAPTSIITYLEKEVKSCYTRNSPLGKIFLLQMQEYGGFDLSPFEVKLSEIDIHKHYNDDFFDVNAIVKKRLNCENDKGLVLLHGKPGTGKTSYIRYLTSQINKRMIFLSPELMHKISSPEFLGILSAYPNSVIIIEDAENVIEERKGGGGSAISNLLNLTDGLLADCLKIQLICSFNTDVSKIDKALLRKGRLIARYDFKDLEMAKAQELSNQLGFSNKIEKDTPLSELFNQEEKTFQSEDGTSIGFAIGNIKVA
jgi:hypothetical protein